MIAQGRAFLLNSWWYPTFPGLAIMLTILGFNLIGDGLRDAWIPDAVVPAACEMQTGAVRTHPAAQSGGLRGQKGVRTDDHGDDARLLAQMVHRYHVAVILS